MPTWTTRALSAEFAQPARLPLNWWRTLFVRTHMGESNAG